MRNRVQEACDACFAAHDGDCSGFVRAVAARLGVTLPASANAIVDLLRDGGGWTRLGGAAAAARSAGNGNFVIAGFKGQEAARTREDGHLAIILGPDPRGGAYPLGAWATKGGGAKARSIDHAWTAPDRDRLTYACHVLF